jgi:hypothetical protein
MLRAEMAWRRSLSGQTVADLVAGLSKRVDQRAVDKTLAWFQEHLRS